MSQPQLKIIQTSEGIENLQTYLKDFEYIAFDSETTGVYKGAQVIGMSFCAEEDAAFYIILAKWETDQLVWNPLTDCAKTLVSSLVGKKLIMHNGLFDCDKVYDNYGIDLTSSLHTDTMILAHLLDENRRIGLKDLGVSIVGGNADKEAKEVKDSVLANGGSVTRDNYEMYKADSLLLAKYGAKDALLTYKLFLHLVPQLYEQGLDKFFYEDESMPLLRGPTHELNTTGLKVDTQKLTQLKKTLEAECAEAKSYIYTEIAPYIKEKYPGTNKKNGFNIGATQQLSWLLFGELGLEFSTLTKAGKEACKDLGMRQLPYTLGAKKQFIRTALECAGDIQKPEGTVNGKKVRAKKFKAPWAYIACDKATLNKLAPKYRWIERLLEYQKKTKILTTYIEGLEERIQYGIIRPSFLQHGTTSGRYSSRNPNFQNLPRDDKRIKECIVARPGKVFVGADYSQLEPRVFAYFSNDQRLLAAFTGSEDFYSVIGMEVYDKIDCTPQKEGSPDAFGVKYKKLRDDSKVIALSTTYGSTAFKLAPTIGKSIEATEQVIADYFEKFPGVKQLMLDSHKQAKTQGFVENLFGRKRRMPEAMNFNKIYGKAEHGDLPYEARNILNLAVNHRIQSTGASIVNRAAIAFHNNKTTAGIDCKLVLQVHDSLVVECNEADAESVALLLQSAMEDTVDLKTIKLEAVPRIGHNLAGV